MAPVFSAHRKPLLALVSLAWLAAPLAHAQQVVPESALTVDNASAPPPETKPTDDVEGAGEDGADYVPTKPLRATNLVCSPTGYAAPSYNTFGQNGGSGAAAFEIASPCIPDLVVLAAEAVGMGRSRPIGVKNVVTVVFTADGTIAGKPVTKANFQISYGIPAMRMDVDWAGATPVKTVQVFADDKATTETKEGMGVAPAPAGALADWSPLIKLTPFGGLWSAVDAEGHTTVKKVKGKDVIEGTSPYDGFDVTTTLDDKHLPIAETVKAGKHTYAATFAGWSDKWEPKYLVIFPEFITWTKDGKPYANLHVTYFHSNPYVIFPPPAPAAPVQTASK